jgi:hypothetical protein
MATRSSEAVEQAMGECRQAVKLGVVVGLPENGDELIYDFMEQFRHDFEVSIRNDISVWNNDRLHITSLATAIGATASFLAVRDGLQPVSKDHLNRAFRMLRSECQLPVKSQSAEDVKVLGRYCASV